jgi:hypothetical protein
MVAKELEMFEGMPGAREADPAIRSPSIALCFRSLAPGNPRHMTIDKYQLSMVIEPSA